MPDGLRLGHNIGGMRFCRSQGVELEISLFTAAAATLSQRTGPFHARWKTDLSLLDPIPASHSPLAGSEAAVPGICWDV
ncbi:Queuine tRNA-ribosyltransferase [Dissostichus eleginoides]|uniref:Queuine tRNA-ribosyltransferase n=1 Tax=Dissostichus eleginoides TaxID=100907 RepID=A0AAD9C511_DISEL|nr:Queuine tRNA-ribosyltransferase [Dissostichus eleginoides]